MILQLFDQLSEVHRRVQDLAEELREVVERDDSPAAPDSDD
jgi:hypothetical protein